MRRAGRTRLHKTRTCELGRREELGADPAPCAGIAYLGERESSMQSQLRREQLSPQGKCVDEVAHFEAHGPPRVIEAH